MDIGIVHSIWTVFLFVSFIAIVIWAYSKRQKQRFEEAANLVFMDDEPEVSAGENDRRES
ncbi:cbb3-type cytochrome oxidase subunit 3 [Photobacterium damselae]|uniref:cbb3-type cytochrome oxidase subunit 3 n=1 Tax=Photobacterium damselae TaxID=38293 RepID=UPI000D9B5786|nr:CcoQ/FixQ family Cbb3-type cytochrome c oxidase assembly chaperone [Photobacterium damselae]NVO75050.1 cbb3-type cytochrome oxidase subunit 3 [Photobacterium damselae subsp. damselae]SPY24129.1 Cbb3-type cytochrome oxidase, subunit 3 [Photobacterium damselae]